MPPMHTLIATLLSLVASFALSACASTTSGPGTPGKAGVISPSWSPSASQTQDDAWHFAYAVQSWAAEQSGHVVMVPARNSIVVDRAFFSDEFSHIPLRALRGVRADDPNRVIVLKHLWTTHASSWDYDTDIKFVLYGPGFVKEGVKLEKTTLQNVAPTYARLIGTNPPKGSMGRVMAEALVPTSKRPRVILTIVMDGGGRSLYEAWPDAWPVIKGLTAQGVEYTDAKVTQLENRDGRLSCRHRDRGLSHHHAHRWERDLRSSEEAGHSVIPRLLARVHHGAHVGRRVPRQRRSQAGSHRNELPGPCGDGHGRPRRGTSPRQ